MVPLPQETCRAGQSVQFGLIGKDNDSIERYVTARALKELYLIIADQEKSFRQ